MKLATCAAVAFAAAALATVAFAGPEPKLLHLPKGAGKVSVMARLDRKTTSREYAIQVSAPIKIKLDVAPVGKSPGVQPTWHITFPSGKQFGAKGYDPFDGALSEKGRYVITVNVNQMASSGTSGKFRLTISK